MLDKKNEAYLDYIRELLETDFTGNITVNVFKGVIGNVQKGFEPPIKVLETVMVKR